MQIKDGEIIYVGVLEYIKSIFKNNTLLYKIRFLFLI